MSSLQQTLVYVSLFASGSPAGVWLQVSAVVENIALCRGDIATLLTFLCEALGTGALH